MGVLVTTKADGAYAISWGRPSSAAGTLARVYLKTDQPDATWQLVAETEGSEVLIPRLIPGGGYIASICLANQRGDVAYLTQPVSVRRWRPAAHRSDRQIVSVFRKSASAG